MRPSPSGRDREPRLTVVGIPGNRRTTLFQDAVLAAGLPPAREVSWLEVLRGRPGFAPGETVRIDSPGEDREVDLLLRGAKDSTRVEGTARWYERFSAAARELGGRVRSAGAELLDDPEELAVLFDKRLCHGVLDAAGVAVPASPTSGAGAPAVGGWDDVRALMAGAGLRRAFVKIAHGSSASGVLAVEIAGPGRVRATTSVERDAAGRLYNSLRVRTYPSERAVAAVVDALAPDGLHIERWLAKGSAGGRSADLRVVVVAGRATHAVVRTSDSPMTNLHLGGARGDLDAIRAETEASGGGWSAALALCEQAADRFPGTHCVGVDLLPSPGWRRFTVCEVNAFGDLLPRLTGLPGSGAEGLDTYGAQLAALPAHAARSRERAAREKPPERTREEVRHGGI
ncbi:STM4014 family protein [Streptomyces corynorhini]|uniref:STM4014 family protein n=1 Tax=Streptomyces corynorhini TaxID=2282652 RepID=UPI0018F6D586|nr:STM4014 family protein [Streptomyces corynorhini]